MRYRLDCLPLGVAGLLVTLLPSTALPHPLLGSRATPMAADPVCAVAGTPAVGTSLADPTRAGALPPAPTAAPGTPVAHAGLRVTLLTESDKARPNDLTVVVVDDACRPVTGATVTIRTRSLEMDHGVRTTTAEEVEPGRYLAERVPMGMAGDWEAEVTVERAGADAAVFVFVVTLEGPR